MPGLPPKDPSRRARRNNKDAGVGRVIQAAPVEPPAELPGDLVHGPWHSATLRWWDRWVHSPLADSLLSVDWSELEMLAVLHHRFHGGEVGLASELRQRIAKFGATPEDRAKLRIQIADADTKEARRPSATAARERFGDLRAVNE